MSEALTKDEHKQLMERITGLEKDMYSRAKKDAVYWERYPTLLDTYYKTLAEYADRLPRPVMGLCPFSGKPLRRSFDPFGLDGPWWWESRICKVEEPPAPPAFRVLQGALALNKRIPTEVKEPVLPGPDVPFLIPRLLELPGMVAVIHATKLDTGDIAYPISYWSETEIPKNCLYQPWLSSELWSDSGWTICSDALDFELAPWIKKGKVMWTEMQRGELSLAKEGQPCPYANISGKRKTQYIADGELMQGEPPDGSVADPYAE